MEEQNNKISFESDSILKLNTKTKTKYSTTEKLIPQGGDRFMLNFHRESKKKKKKNNAFYTLFKDFLDFFRHLSFSYYIKGSVCLHFSISQLSGGLF